jgi:hypothetical protein
MRDGRIRESELNCFSFVFIIHLCFTVFLDKGGSGQDKLFGQMITEDREILRAFSGQNLIGESSK